MNKKQEQAIKQFHCACNMLACMVNDQLFGGDRQWSWIADEVGGACDFDDTDVLKVKH